MLNLLNPDLAPANVYFNSFGDAIARVTVGYNLLNNALKNDNASSTRRARLSTYLTGTYMPRCLVLFQPDDLADVIAFAEALKDDAEAQVAIND